MASISGLAGDPLSPRGRGNHPPRYRRHGGSGSIPARAGEPRVTVQVADRIGVYPRAGGGTRLICRAAPIGPGLSPRGRGNRARLGHAARGRGSIPARAGEPTPSPRAPPAARVYPRAGGGTGVFGVDPDTVQGLSPRGRGNPSPCSKIRAGAGSIPARAGEPATSSRSGAASRVYPRAGGGTVAFPISCRPMPGLSPRGRGNRQQMGSDVSRGRSIPARAGEPSGRRCNAWRNGVYPRAGGGTRWPRSPPRARRGLSPRGRGNQRAARDAGAPDGSIPARAGEPTTGCAGACCCRVYPRAGGGTKRVYTRMPNLEGLSPRGRGNRHQGRPRRADPGSIPARAGEPALRSSWRRGRRVYPRAGGGTSMRLQASACAAGLSPRGRGNLRGQNRQLLDLGSIPARAGEPSAPTPTGTRIGVYPRAGGGTDLAGPIGLEGMGLSPRGRGNPRRRAVALAQRGSIPARAGEPSRSRPPGRPTRVYPRAGGGTADHLAAAPGLYGLSPRGRGNPRLR